MANASSSKKLRRAFQVAHKTLLQAHKAFQARQKVRSMFGSSSEVHPRFDRAHRFASCSVRLQRSIEGCLETRIRPTLESIENVEGMCQPSRRSARSHDVQLHVPSRVCDGQAYPNGKISIDAGRDDGMDDDVRTEPIQASKQFVLSRQELSNHLFPAVQHLRILTRWMSGQTSLHVQTDERGDPAANACTSSLT